MVNKKFAVVMIIIAILSIYTLTMTFLNIKKSVKWVNITNDDNNENAYGFYEMIETLEEWVKHGPIHNYIHNTYDAKPHYFMNKPNTTVLFLHIARTTGGAIRYHLLNGIGLDLSLDDILNVKPYTETQIKEYSQEPFIKDFMSWSHVEQFIEYNISVKTFTILRDPIERTLSWYKMSKKGLRIPGIRKELDIKSFFRHKNRYIQSYINNSMTFQFASYRDIEYRGNMTEENALDLAKQHLKQCDYVGFYETMFTDFYRLKSKIFGNNLCVDLFTYYIYEIGILFSWFRMRTKKYSNELSEDEMKYIENVNNLDIQLWQWSLKQYNKKFIMFDDYIHAVPLGILLLIIILSILIIICKCLKYIVSAVCCKQYKLKYAKKDT